MQTEPGTGRRLTGSGPVAVLLYLLLGAPVVAGLLATVLPAFGYLPGLATRVGLDAFRALFSVPGLLQSMQLSLITGLATTVVSAGLVLAFVAAFAGTPGFRRMQIWLAPILSVPHAAVAFGLSFLIAPSGLLLRLVSPWLTGFEQPPDWLIVQDPMGLAMIAGLVIKEVPFLLLMAIAALPQTGYIDAQRLMGSLGYGRMAGFLLACGPRLYQQMRLPVLAVLAYSVSVSDVALILGPQLPPTLAVQIMHWMADPDLSLRLQASAGALVQIGVLVLAFGLWVGLEQIVSQLFYLFGSRGRRYAQDRFFRQVLVWPMALCGLAVFLGIVVLALWSIAGLWPFPQLLPQTVSLGLIMKSLPAAADPLLTSVELGLVSALIAMVMTIGLLNELQMRNRTLSATMLAVLYMPLLVPQISFVSGLQILQLSMGLEPQFLTLVAVHLIFVLPYTVLSLQGPWQDLDPRFDRISASFGKSRWRVLWEIRLPLLMKPIFTATAVGFAVSIGLYLPTLLLGAGRISTITTEAVSLASGGDRRIIGIYAILQALLPFAGFMVASLLPRLLWRQQQSRNA